MGEARHLTTGGVAMHNVLLRRTHDNRFGFRHGGERARSVAGGDRFLDLSYRAAQTRATRPIDHCTALSLASGLLCGLCVSHDLARRFLRESFAKVGL